MPVNFKFPVGIIESGGVVRDDIMNTSGFNSKEETLNAYGSSVYIYESNASSLKTLSDTITEYGGLNSQNNFIGGAEKLYGIQLDNWSGEDTRVVGLVTYTPVSLSKGTLLFKINAFVSSWITESFVIGLIKKTDATDEEMLSTIYDKIVNDTFDEKFNFSYPGSDSLIDRIYHVELEQAGEFFLYLGNISTRDNSGFTPNIIRYANF